MPTRGTFSSIIVIALGCTLVPVVTARAQPPNAPFELSGPFDLNTNRIGFADADVILVTPVPDARALPDVVALGDPSPNPFNPRVTIPFAVGRPGVVELRIYDLQGRRVRQLANQEVTEGHYTWQWDGRSDRGSTMPAGVYLIQIRLHDVLAAKKISLVR